jgi:heme-degrading monooxygenase HmoA
MIAHNVYFTLNDNSAAAIEAMLAASDKHLTGHPGVVFFAIGTLVAELQRPVNDRDFDVALQVVFDSMAAHDQYQQSERHKAFLAERKGNWKKVRVFDAIVKG